LKPDLPLQKIKLYILSFNMPDNKSTIALITGGNQGIGRAVATSLAKDHGCHVIIGSRKLAAGEAVAVELQAAGHAASAVQLDVNSDSSIALAVSTITEKFGQLDVLVNNAGIILDKASFVEVPDLSTRELFEKTFQTNVFGAACLTEALLPLLRKSSSPRVVFVSSIMGSLQMSTNPSVPWYQRDYKAYDASKAAANILAVNYARILADVGGKVNAACPGLVSTSMTGHNPMGTSTEVGAQRIVELATLESDGPTATFSNRDGPLPW
jgi:NAD(P)-dependent dehydrogenase (short-subunit alcohol dehydrogenase family)